MNPIVLLVVFVITMAFLFQLPKGKRSPKAEHPYSKRTHLFSAAERSFLGVLEQATKDEFRVFGKVRIADVIEPIRGLDKSTWQSAFNRVSAKHFDFILCSPADLSVLLAVELNDKTHKRTGRKQRDYFVLSACESAGLPLLNIDARRGYSVQEVKELLVATLSPPGGTRIEPRIGSLETSGI
jgi:hypothetical protein